MTDIKAIVQKQNYTPIWLGKAVNYEYWPVWFFYIPIGLYITYLAMKARSATFFTGVNPSFKDSGIIRYSKFEVLSLISEQVKPKGVLIKSGTSNIVLPLQLSFPVIAKPDMGERGKGVTIVYDLAKLQHYSDTINQDFIIQEFCDFPQEAAIFYVRKPSESRGRITSFTTKEFLSVTGDGYKNIDQLMSLSFRAKLQKGRMSPEFLSRVPQDGERVKIEPIGNHNRGTRFINSNHLITEKLVSVFDEISKQIDGFFYGRFDLKFFTINELENGNKIKIVELNGINSEPVHIYDQQTGLFNAYKDFFTHMRYMYEISEENKLRGIKRTGASRFWVSIFSGKG